MQNLRKEVAKLRAQQQEADRLRAENQQLLAASRAAQPISEDDFFARTDDPGEKALSIQCVNNLKQIGLSARVWANDDPYAPRMNAFARRRSQVSVPLFP